MPHVCHQLMDPRRSKPEWTTLVEFEVCLSVLFLLGGDEDDDVVVGRAPFLSSSDPVLLALIFASYAT